MQQPDIVRYHRAIALLVPSGAVQRQHGKRPLTDPSADFLQMQVHRFEVGVRQHEPGADAPRRADGAEQVGPLIALIAWCCRSAAPLRPDARQAALLTNTSFVLPPQLDRLALCGRGMTAATNSAKFFYAPPALRHRLGDGVAAPRCG